MKVLDRLERIDGETDEMDIIFVKMGDPRYARKWGVTKLPAIVYFRNRFPSIYRGRYNNNVHSDFHHFQHEYKSNIHIPSLKYITEADVRYCKCQQEIAVLHEKLQFDHFFTKNCN